MFLFHCCKWYIIRQLISQTDPVRLWIDSSKLQNSSTFKTDCSLMNIMQLIPSFSGWSRQTVPWWILCGRFHHLVGGAKRLSLCLFLCSSIGRSVHSGCSPWYNRHGWLGVKNQLPIHSGRRLRMWPLCLIPPATWAATFHLQRFNIVYAGLEGYSFYDRWIWDL